MNDNSVFPIAQAKNLGVFLDSLHSSTSTAVLSANSAPPPNYSPNLITLCHLCRCHPGPKPQSFIWIIIMPLQLVSLALGRTARAVASKPKTVSPLCPEPFHCLPSAQNKSQSPYLGSQGATRLGLHLLHLLYLLSLSLPHSALDPLTPRHS